jgi:hypothetical protein
MGWYTDWFLAEESDAERIASMSEDAESDAEFDDWPHLSMKNIGVDELAHLGEVLTVDYDGVGDTVYFNESEEEPVMVARVPQELIEALARIGKSDLARVVQAWAKCENLSDWKPADLTQTLSEMIALAAQAVREKKPVLELLAM